MLAALRDSDIHLGRALRALLGWRSLGLLALGALAGAVVPSLGGVRPTDSRLLVALGALAGLFAAVLWSGWRSRVPAGSLAAPAPCLFAKVCLAALLLTPAMDRLLAVDVGPFTARLGHLCGLLLLLALVVASLRQRKPVAVPALPLLGSASFLSIAAAASLGTGFPIKSAGYLAWAGFDVLAILVAAGWWAAGANLERALRFWFAGMALAAAMGFAQLVGWKLGLTPPFLYFDNNGFPRINGFSYEPSYFALYLVPGALVSLTRFALLGRPAWKSGALSAGLLVAVALSTSRSGWLGAAAGVAGVGALALRAGGARAARRMGWAAAGLAGALALLLATWTGLRVQVADLAARSLDFGEKHSTGPRLESLRQALEIGRRNPFFGVGLGGYGAYVEAHPDLKQPGQGGAFELVTTNLWLETFAETGATGLLACLAMLVALLWPRPLRRPEAQPPGLRASRLGLLLAAGVVFAVLFQFSQTLWRLDIWVMLGLSFAAFRAAESEPGTLPATASEERRAGPSPGGQDAATSALG